jgi:hypothetical protein
MVPKGENVLGSARQVLPYRLSFAIIATSRQAMSETTAMHLFRNPKCCRAFVLGIAGLIIGTVGTGCTTYSAANEQSLDTRGEGARRASSFMQPPAQ